MSRAMVKFARQASPFEHATRPWLAVKIMVEGTLDLMGKQGRSQRR
jgi:hypothetical protein